MSRTVAPGIFIKEIKDYRLSGIYFAPSSGTQDITRTTQEKIDAEIIYCLEQKEEENKPKSRLELVLEGLEDFD